jgi:phospholipid transport system substrate-binding protein
MAACVSVFLLAAWSTSSSIAGDDVDPSRFIQSLADRSLMIMGDNDDQIFDEREIRFRKLLIEGFDLEVIARFVVGRHWRTASDTQRAAYLELFPDYFVRIYSSRFGSFSGETVEIVRTQKSKSGDSFVQIRVNSPAVREPLHLDFRVRKVEGAYKVIDVMVEGISLLLTQRAEFTSVIAKKGFDGFLATLRERMNAIGPNGQTV